MAQTNDDVKIKLLHFVRKSYRTAMTSIINKYSTIEKVKCEEINRHIHSAISYLCRDLTEVILSLEHILTSVPDTESFIVEDFISEIHYVSILLRSNVNNDMEESIINIKKSVHGVSSKVLNLFIKIESNRYEFNEFEYQLLEIIYEVGSAFVKVVIFTAGRLNLNDLIVKCQPTLERVILSIKMLCEQNDKILIYEFIRYINCSLKFLNKYLNHIHKTIIRNFRNNIFATFSIVLRAIYIHVKFHNQTNSNILKILQQCPNTSEKVRYLLATVADYVVFYTSTITSAVNTGNPIDNMMNIMDQIRIRLFSLLQLIVLMLTSKPNKNETVVDQLMQEGALAFAETMQNVALISEVINAFRLHDL